MVGIYCFFGLPPPIFVKKPLTLLEYICLSSKSGPFLPDLALFVTKTCIHGQQVSPNLAFRPHVWRNSLLCDRFYPGLPKNLSILPYWTSFLALFGQFLTFHDFVPLLLTLSRYTITFIAHVCRLAIPSAMCVLIPSAEGYQYRNKCCACVASVLLSYSCVYLMNISVRLVPHPSPY